MAKKKLQVVSKSIKQQGDPGYWRMLHDRITNQHKASARHTASVIACSQRTMCDLNSF